MKMEGEKENSYSISKCFLYQRMTSWFKNVKRIVSKLQINSCKLFWWQYLDIKSDKICLPPPKTYSGCFHTEVKKNMPFPFERSFSQVVQLFSRFLNLPCDYYDRRLSPLNLSTASTSIVVMCTINNCVYTVLIFFYAKYS